MFFADSFFVEKPERIETILWIMTICLLVYNLGQRELKKWVKKKQELCEKSSRKVNQ